ncbi:MAG: hypothetical protein RLZZ609_1308 [Cyanobacteriota bacterium]
MDPDLQRDSHHDHLRDLPPDRLEVLIDLDIQEGTDPQTEGWDVVVVEHLRLQVPADAQQAWIQAELQTWDPWLRQQKGFLGRKVLWDSDRQEGVLLIHWANRQDWKSIPPQVVAAVQEDFEAAAKRILALPAHNENPFPLVYAGETRVS